MPRSDLVYLILLASVHGLWIGRRPQPELGIAEVSVSVDVVQTLPDDLLLREETLVCNQEVQLALMKKKNNKKTHTHYIHTSYLAHTIYTRTYMGTHPHNLYMVVLNVMVST